MRRKDRKITEQETLEILRNGEYGILSTVGTDHVPYGLPLNYCLINHTIYFHSAREGQKLNHIFANPNVSFCVVGKTQVEPEHFSTKFESCIVQGVAREAFDNEKQIALEGLVEKYSHDFVDKGSDYIQTSGHQTRVIGITIQSLSGKAKR